MMNKLIFTLIFLSVFLATTIQLGHAQNETGNGKELIELDIVLVIDNSGSMKQNDPKLLTREVVTNFVNGLDKNARLGMVVFDQEATLVESLEDVNDTQKKAKFLKSLENINYKGKFTNSPDAIERAIYELKTHSRKDSQKVIIFLTDGIVDTGDKARDIEKEKWLKEDLARDSKKAGIRIIGIAFTDNADFLLIQSLSIKTDGEYFRAYAAEDIQGTFEKIYDLITKPTVKPEAMTPEKKSEALMPSEGMSEEKTFNSKSASPDASPGGQKTGLSLPLLIAGIIVILSLVILFVVFKGKSKKGIKITDPIVQPHMPKAELIDVKSIISKESIKLQKPNIEIGRDAKRDITIPEDTVSDFHATICYKDGCFYLEDQRSTNGTSLGGKKIEPNKPIKLKSGDKINFDVYEFRFVLPDEGQAGGTVLSVKAPQTSGTVLRTPKQKKDSDQEIRPFSEKEPADQSPQPEGKTRLKPGMCPNHPARKAAELCMVCKNAFCKQCMTEKDGKQICSHCADKDQ